MILNVFDCAAYTELSCNSGPISTPGVYVSPGYTDSGDGAYGDSMDCEWLIQTQPGQVRLHDGWTYPLDIRYKS